MLASQLSSKNVTTRLSNRLGTPSTVDDDVHEAVDFGCWMGGWMDGNYLVFSMRSLRGRLVATIFVIRFFPQKLLEKLFGKFGWKIGWKIWMENVG